MTLKEATDLERALSRQEAATHFVMARCGDGPMHDLLAVELEELRFERVELRAAMLRRLGAVA